MTETTESRFEYLDGRTVIIERTDGLLTELKSIVEIGFGFDTGAVLEVESITTFDPVTGLPTEGFFDEVLPWTDVDVRQDTGDRPWDTIETRRDADGEIVFRETLRDDGLNTRFVASGFGDSVTMQADSDDVRNWSFRAVIENDVFDQRSVFTIFDDDRVRGDSFNSSGVLVQRDEADVGDVYDWAERYMVWDEDGARDFTRIVRDDGRVIEKDYDAGVLRSVFTEDSADAFNWVEIERSFDDDGRLERVEELKDDGRVIERDYDAGVLRNVRITDTADAFDWTAIERIYDEDGTFIEEILFPDIDPADYPGLGSGDGDANDLLGDLSAQLPDGSELALAPPTDDYAAIL